MKSVRRGRARGFSLIEVSVMSSLISILFLAIMSFTKIMGKQQLQVSSAFQVSNVSHSFVSNLRNHAAWTKTVADVANRVPGSPGDMSCLQPGSTLDCATACNGGMCGGAFRANDASGQPLNGHLPGVQKDGSTGYGFTSDGQSCSTYTKNGGNDACPYELILVWKPICAGAPCVSPQVQVSGRWKYSPRTPQRTIAFNSRNYEIAPFSPGSLAGSAFPRFQVFDANGTWQAPPTVSEILVEVWGAGGGGAGAYQMSSAQHPANCAGGGGGGGGGYCRALLIVTPGRTYSITVGRGGVPGAAGADGGNGTSSNFDSLISAGGGMGGLAPVIPATGNTMTGFGGAGGTCNLSTTINAESTPGSPGRAGEYNYDATFGAQGGDGGSAGRGGAQGLPGGGGMGGSAYSPLGGGAAGNHGRVIVSWYF